MVWIVILLILVVAGIIAGLLEITRNMRAMVERVKTVNVEFWESPKPQIKPTSRRQLKG